jgi:hypothetical protein
MCCHSSARRNDIDQGCNLRVATADQATSGDPPEIVGMARARRPHGFPR